MMPNNMNNSIAIDLSFTFPLSKEPRPNLDLNLTLPCDGITVVFGPSGSGKTTLLRCLAGLEPRAQGHITVNDKAWLSPKTNLAAHKRNLGYVPQQPSLFPHLTIEKNLLYGLTRRQSHANTQTLAPLVKLLGLTTLLPRLPRSLSLGEQQRVAIARAIVTEPALLLMDEPLASLDVNNKQEILGYLSQLRKRYSIPIIYVTHSIEEVVTLADNLVLMKQGRVTEHGSVVDVFPTLLESINVTQKIFVTGTPHYDTTNKGRAFINVGEETFWLNLPDSKHNKIVLVSIDQHDIVLSRSRLNQTTIENQFAGNIESILFDDATSQYQVKIRALGQSINMALSLAQQASLSLVEGDELNVAIVRADVIV